jgi:hypothetical protein
MRRLREWQAELERGEGLDETQLRTLLASHGR